MGIRNAITIRELSDDVTGKNEQDDRLVVWHILALEVRVAGHDPVRVPVTYFEKVEDGQQYAGFVTRIGRSGVPRPARPIVRQALLTHLGRRFEVSRKAWPAEPIPFEPGDVILSIHGDAWKFAPADAKRFLEAWIEHQPKGADGSQPIASDYGGVLVEGVRVLALHYDDDWSAENLQELIHGLQKRIATTANEGELA